MKWKASKTTDRIIWAGYKTYKTNHQFTITAYLLAWIYWISVSCQLVAVFTWFDFGTVYSVKLLSAQHYIQYWTAVIKGIKINTTSNNSWQRLLEHQKMILKTLADSRSRRFYKRWVTKKLYTIRERF